MSFESHQNYMIGFPVMGNDLPWKAVQLETWWPNHKQLKNVFSSNPSFQWTSSIYGFVFSIFSCSKRFWLVVSTPLKNMNVSWDDYSQYMEK